MKKAIVLLAFFLMPVVLAAQDRIEKIEVLGNDKVARDTILYYLSSKEGDSYMEDIFRKDLRVLWSTGFFSNIKIEEQAGLKGKIVKITVEENPVIKNITYKTGSKISESDIVNKLKEKGYYLLPYSYFSAAKIKKIQDTILDLLQEKGLEAAKVNAETEKKGKNEVEILFRINEGSKVRVGEIVFQGKTKIPESFLREAMKNNQQHSLFSWITGKDAFKENKLAESVELIKKRFQEAGYMEAVVGEPKVETITKKNILFKTQTMKRIVIPVNPGYLYRVGDITVEGMKALTADIIKTMIKMKKGDTYSTKIRETSVKTIGDAYRDGGFLYAQIDPVESLDPKRKVVNVNYTVREGEVAFLNKLEFRGNNYTKDKVIRREMLIREGDPFRFSWFRDSLLRIKQLGLVDVDKDPEVKPRADNPALIDTTINVKELQRNNIQFSAGYSGYEGTFVAASYSTVNFLGAGESLDLTLQYGKRVKNYVFGFTEPYFLDLPINVGFNIFSRYMVYPGLYDQKSKGINLTVGGRIVGPWRANLVYSYENVDAKIPEGVDVSGYDPIYMSMFGYGTYNISSLNPSIYRTTIDSPLTPMSGVLYSASCRFAGSFLGGEIDMIKPRLEWTMYVPTLRFKQSFGVHLLYETIYPIGDSQIPFWERFYLGGERNIRGYEIYSIGSRSASGTVLGGEKQLVFNAEYIIRMGNESPLFLIFFHDRGNAVLRNEKISLKNMYSSTGMEMRIFVPALRVPFRLIFAYNTPKLFDTDSNFAFRFAIGTTF